MPSSARALLPIRHDGHADVGGLVEVADDSDVRRLVQADEHDGVGDRVGKRVVRGVVDDRVAVHRATRREHASAERHRAARVAHLLGRMDERRARRALLHREGTRREPFPVRVGELRNTPVDRKRTHVRPSRRARRCPARSPGPTPRGSARNPTPGTSTRLGPAARPRRRCRSRGCRPRRGSRRSC